MQKEKQERQFLAGLADDGQTDLSNETLAPCRRTGGKKTTDGNGTNCLCVVRTQHITQHRSKKDYVVDTHQRLFQFNTSR